MIPDWIENVIYFQLSVGNSLDSLDFSFSDVDAFKPNSWGDVEASMAFISTWIHNLLLLVYLLAP